MRSQSGLSAFVRLCVVATVFVFQLPNCSWSLQDSPPETASQKAAAEKQDVSAADDGFVQLFNGENLEGWTNPFSWGVAEVVDGEIHLTADRKFFLVTESTWSDFVLEAEICLPESGAANSGIMFRCHVEPDKVFGYQAECDPKDRAWTGGLYDEGRRGWLFPKGGQEKYVHLVQAPMGEWIRYRIECEGDHIRIFINDSLVTDHHDDVDAAGHVGIQHHGEKGQTYRFRNIRLKNLASDGKKPDSTKVPLPAKSGDGKSGDAKTGDKKDGQ